MSYEDELGDLNGDFNIDDVLAIPSGNLGTSLPNIPSSAGNDASLLSKSYDIKKSLGKALNNDIGSYNGGGISKSRKNSIISKEETIERKRRDNINEKIQELLDLIPENFFTDDKSTGTKDGKPNKGQILTKSVEYIQYLQNEIDENNRKEVELQMKIKDLEVAKGVEQSTFHGTTGERILARIGVGPAADPTKEE